MIKTPCILFTQNGEVLPSTTEIPEPGPGEVLVDIQFSAISPGTELRCLTGRQPGVNHASYIPGYSQAGVIRRVGAGSAHAPGDRVYLNGTRAASHPLAWGGHTGMSVAAPENVFPVPGKLDLRTAAFAHLAAIAYHGLRLSRPAPHETVVVVGLGPIGQFCARLYAAAGTRVIGVDVDRLRVSALEKTHPEITGRTIQDSPQEIRDSLVPEGADIVVDATGAPPVLAKAAALLRTRGVKGGSDEQPRLIVQGSYEKDFIFPYWDVFYKEAAILVPRDTTPEDIRAALEMMARGKLRVDDWAGQTASPSDAPAIYGELMSPGSGLLTAAFEWPSTTAV